jgi:hypothetical protein
VWQRFLVSRSRELAVRYPRFTATYLTFDARSLGVARVYLGLLLMADLLRRVPGIRTWYSNDGLLPNHLLLWHPGADYQFSLFFLASHFHEAVALFLACGCVFVAFLAGYRTRLFHLLSLVCICSLHSRLILFDDGSETTTRLLVFWTLFLPMGQRYSVDALLRRDRQKDASVSSSVVSLAVLAILLQLAFIYVFNALHKTGTTWRTGSAVHYVLHQDRIVTWLGLLVRNHLTPGASRVMSWSAVATEAVLPLLILSPFKTKYTRRAAVVLGIGLHLAFAALLNLGMFSFNMIGFFLLLPSAEDWQSLERFRPGRRYRTAVVRMTRCVRRFREPLAGRGREPTASSWAPIAREALVIVFAVTLGRQMLMQNAAVPKALRPKRQPDVLRMLVEYPRLFEGWGMFAPDAPLTDSMLYADALTVDGRHVDPINLVASRGVTETPPHEIPPFLDNDDAWCDYMVTIPDRADYQGPLKDWLFAYSKRTGRPEDEIVDVVVGVIEDHSPPPGRTTPTDVTTRTLFHAVPRE